MTVRPAARLRLLAAGALLALVAPSAAQEGAPSIRFSTPRSGATVLGAGAVELEVRLPAGTEVARIDITVDGKPLATLHAPPWKASWDAGQGESGHVLRARLVLQDGREATAEIRTAPLRVDLEEEVALVNVYAVASDAEGRYVTDLKRDEFLVSESGHPQRLDRFSAERKPLRIALVMDTSLSMKGDKIRAAKDAVVALLDILEPGDQGIVVTFSDQVHVAQGLTGDKKLLADAIRAAEAQGGTALYDALWDASEKLQEFDGRRVLVLLSDGRDEAASGLEPGSLHTQQEALDRALRNEVMIFAVGFGASLARDARRLERDPDAAAEEMDFYGREPLVTILRRLAYTTGGRGLFSGGSGQLRKTFEQVAEDLRHQYSLAYQSDDTTHDGKWRSIEVKTTRPGLTLNYRKGYYAPRSSPLPRPPRRG